MPVHMRIISSIFSYVGIIQIRLQVKAIQLTLSLLTKAPFCHFLFLSLSLIWQKLSISIRKVPVKIQKPNLQIKAVSYRCGSA